MNMLGRNEFEILRALAIDGELSQREISEVSGLSLGTVNSTLKGLLQAGYLSYPNGSTSAPCITDTGLTALDNHKVENAVILAAGLSTRFAPISYEKPKGLLMVRGEILIERQIRQLREVGIQDIYVVVGYKKEQYFYLEDLCDVHIIVNEEYAYRNNHSSVAVAAQHLGNSYLCSSDVYYEYNPFSAYEWKSYYSAQFCEGETEEWCISTGSGKRITAIEIGGKESWFMIGHAYFDRAFSEEFLRILEAEYDLPETRDKLWEHLYVDHIKELDMVMKPYDGGMHEFDSLDELREFDADFLENIDSEIFDNIENTLGCSREEISDIFPLKQGITNLSCHFSVGDREYVYRHPGVGTDKLVNRDCESEIQEIARKLGLDDTFIHEDPKTGWKISRYVPNCQVPNVEDDGQLAQMMRLMRTLHEADCEVDAEFDFYDESRRYEELLGGRERIEIPGYLSMAKRIDQLHEYVSRDESRKCLSHNDFWPMNILIDGNKKMHLIDWEYAGMGDYANDFGTFVVETQLQEEDAIRALCAYFDRKPTLEEKRHNFAFAAFAGWCWYLWSLYKESQGENVGKWLHVYYRMGKDYLEKSLKLYQQDT